MKQSRERRLIAANKWPKPLGTCRFHVPPGYSGNWTEEDWNRKIGLDCKCYGHLMFKHLNRE